MDVGDKVRNVAGLFTFNPLPQLLHVMSLVWSSGLYRF